MRVYRMVARNLHHGSYEQQFNILDGRATFWMDIGLFMGSFIWPKLKSFCGGLQKSGAQI